MLTLKAFAALSTLVATATQSSAFPWLNPSFTDAHLKRGLDAIQRDTDLAQQIRELYTRQKEEVRAWNEAGKPDIAREVLSSRKRDIERRQNNGTVDAILGPEDGVLSVVVNSFAASVKGSKYFPEEDHPFRWPGETDQRGGFFLVVATIG